MIQQLSDIKVSISMNIHDFKMTAEAPVIGSKAKQKEGRMVSTVSVLINKKVEDFPEISPRDFFLHMINQNCITRPFIM